MGVSIFQFLRGFSPEHLTPVVPVAVAHSAHNPDLCALVGRKRSVCQDLVPPALPIAALSVDKSLQDLIRSCCSLHLEKVQAYVSETQNVLITSTKKLLLDGCHQVLVLFAGRDLQKQYGL